MSTSNRPDAPYLGQAGAPDPDRPRQRGPLVAGVALFTLIVGLGVWVVYGLERTPGMAGEDMAAGDGMAEMDVGARFPAVLGYYEGAEVRFVHTEASDPEIAELLTGMMDSPVPAVPSLADVPDDALSAVYVFTNGIAPDDAAAGPLGFQPDVFDTAPGDAGYTPLRRLVEVTWVRRDQARLLTSVADIDAAEAAGQLTVEPTDVVVVAPLLTWPDGRR